MSSDPHIKVIGLPDDVRVAKDLIMAVLDTKVSQIMQVILQKVHTLYKINDNEIK